MTSKRFELKRTPGMPVSTEEILSDLKRVANELHTDTLTQTQYAKHGKYSLTAATRRFGGLSKALLNAGLRVSYEGSTSDQCLFENIEQLWIKLGRQPRKRDLVKPLSQYSETRYNNRFGSWRKSLERFIDYINSQDETDKVVQELLSDGPERHSTRREPSLRLKFLVMRRDSFKCQYCGKSPATHSNVELQIDHITPWSKGGETVINNLRTLCGDCNLGKLNLSESVGG
jgi:hypothetical protein